MHTKILFAQSCALILRMSVCVCNLCYNCSKCLQPTHLEHVATNPSQAGLGFARVAQNCTASRRAKHNRYTTGVCQAPCDLVHHSGIQFTICARVTHTFAKGHICHNCINAAASQRQPTRITLKHIASMPRAQIVRCECNSVVVDICSD